MFFEMADREESVRRVRIQERDWPVGIWTMKTPEPMKRGQSVRDTAAHARGIYEVEIALAGHRAFNIVNTRGEVAFIQVPESWATRGFIRRLMWELDRQDKTQLQLIKPGA